MLLDYGYDISLIAKNIDTLYSRDWASYWYGTKIKNNSFLAFTKYIELYGNRETTTLKFSLNGASKELILS